MATKIEWTEATWNPVTGCRKVSEGCDHCYAETFAERWRGIPGHPFEQGFDVRLWPERLTLPLRWRKPRKVFVNSMSDLFIDEVGDDLVAKVFAVMVAAPQHTCQVLTKRHGRMRALLSREAFWLAVADELGRLWNRTPPAPLHRAPPWIWLGISAKNQRWADIHIPALLDTPAGVRFISAEPLLGPIRLDPQWLSGPTAPKTPCRCRSLAGARLTAAQRPGKLPARPEVHKGCLDWVIVGGESGPRHRPMDLDWLRSLRDQCVGARTPFFFKQVGGRSPKAGGRDLDGRTCDQMPDPVGVS
jgi:protein gp37